VPAAGLRVEQRRWHPPARQPGKGGVDTIPRGEAIIVRHPDMMAPPASVAHTAALGASVTG
jgi:hypothetical protein